MTIELKKNMTISEFQGFIEHPENAEKRFEFIEGEIIDVPSNPLASEIAVLISFFIRLFLRENNLKGHITGEGGGYIINGHVFAPDVAYLSHDRQSKLDSKGFNQVPPELAVEVISDPTNSTEQTDLRRKLAHYRTAGVTTWVVDYVARKVEVHLPDNTVTIYDDTMKLTAEHILPGFELAVKDIFPASEEDQA